MPNLDPDKEYFTSKSSGYTQDCLSQTPTLKDTIDDLFGILGFKKGKNITLDYGDDRN